MATPAGMSSKTSKLLHHGLFFPPDGCVEVVTRRHNVPEGVTRYESYVSGDVPRLLPAIGPYGWWAGVLRTRWTENEETARVHHVELLKATLNAILALIQTEDHA